MSTPEDGSTDDAWDIAAKKYNASKGRARREPMYESVVPNQRTNTPDSADFEEQSIQQAKADAKNAGLEASIHANMLANEKEAVEKNDIQYVRAGRASPAVLGQFKSIYRGGIEDEIRESIRKSPTSPVPIPKRNWGGRRRTKRRGSNTGKNTRRGKRARKSKKATRKSKKSKKSKRKNRKTCRK